MTDEHDSSPAGTGDDLIEYEKAHSSDATEE
jgi:hypothetical protein